MANRDIVVSHQTFFDQEAYDALTFSDIQRFSSTAQAPQECGEGLGQTQDAARSLTWSAIARNSVRIYLFTLA